MTEVKYRYTIVEFDWSAAIKRIIVVVVIAAILASLNPLTSGYTWVKAGENFVLFFPVIVGILLYGFAAGAVFGTFLMFIGWFILTLSSLFIQVPREMLFLLFFLHVTLMLPLILAMDYWGFTDGIKKIERI